MNHAPAIGQWWSNVDIFLLILILSLCVWNVNAGKPAAIERVTRKRQRPRINIHENGRVERTAHPNLEQSAS